MPARSGVTLVELMIVIMIIAVLAGMILGVASVAGETAREAHSRHMVARLHTLLMEHMDTYKTRRVRLRERIGNTPGVEEAINAAFNTPQNLKFRGPALAEARLYAKREMMLMEVPDRWSDVLLASIGNSPLAPLYLNQRTELANVYLRRYLRLVDRTNTLSGNTNTAEDIVRNEGAECLYMVITVACGDGEARTLFHESSIGDSDGDGAPEFLDGWGRPINFLRWAPGFVSETQLNANLLQQDVNAWKSAAERDHDPYDLFRSDPLAFRLIPLIYSPGRDESSGLYASPADYVAWRKNANNAISVNQNARTAPFLSPRLTPYELQPTNDLELFLGTDLGEKTATDNVHNHLLGTR